MKRAHKLNGHRKRLSRGIRRVINRRPKKLKRVEGRSILGVNKRQRKVSGSREGTLTDFVRDGLVVIKNKLYKSNNFDKNRIRNIKYKNRILRFKSKPLKMEDANLNEIENQFKNINFESNLHIIEKSLYYAENPQLYKTRTRSIDTPTQKLVPTKSIKVGNFTCRYEIDSIDMYLFNIELLNGNQGYYPLVYVPDYGTRIVPKAIADRTDFIVKAGHCDGLFKQKLKANLDSDVILLDNCVFPINRRTVLYPDIAIEFEAKGKTVYVDIEIDEPYAASGAPIHTSDNPRDEFRNSCFVNQGWVVVRFSELQVARYSDECILFIKKIINAHRDDTVVVDLDMMFRDSKWDEDDACQMIRNKYRDTYLGDGVLISLAENINIRNDFFVEGMSEDIEHLLRISLQKSKSDQSYNPMPRPWEHSYNRGTRGLQLESNKSDNTTNLHGNFPQPGSGRIWKLKNPPSHLANEVLPEVMVSMSKSNPTPEELKILSALFAARGLTSKYDIWSFFNPRLENLHNPFLMADMDKAVERLKGALDNKERIMVYGDYDVDGTTAVALVYEYLSKLTEPEFLSTYIPDRDKEGYGISKLGIEKAKDDRAALIIALDCGIKSIDKVAYAAKLGVDMIICDHHRPGPKLPKAVAVLDPKRPDCPYPFKELTGCGIGFKLMQALAQRNSMPVTDLVPLLDLVAVSTACDIVPVNGENRMLTHFGLKQLNADKRPAFRAMKQMAKVRRPLTVTDLVFMIGPRINAAGRIEHGRLAVELLLAQDSEEAERKAAHIDSNNIRRQQLDKETTLKALEHIAGDAVLREAWSTVVFNEDWHKGVIGIVASRLVERHYRPTVVLTQSQGKAVGSARSVKGFDVYEAISACSDLLEQFGGHMYAAGLTMPLENVEAFRQRFEEVVRGTIAPHMRVPEEEVDVEIAFRDISDGLVNALNRMAPFGPANMRPVFLTRGVVCVGQPRIVGEDHLKMTLAEASEPRRTLDAIAFKQAHHADMVRSGAPFSILYTIEENEWNGRRSVQLNVKDIKPGVEGVLAGDTSGQVSAELSAMGQHT